DNPPIRSSCTPASGSRFPIGMTTVTCRARNSLGVEDTCSFKITVRLAEPREIKREALERLIRLRNLTTDNDRDRLNRAIDDVRASLADALWKDNSHLNHRNGSEVFDLEEDALYRLQQILNSSRSGIA